MKLTNAEVVEYFNARTPGLSFDDEVLSRVIDSFDCPVTMETIFNRHNDVLSGRTVLNGTRAQITMRSSITELPITKETLLSCNKSCIFHLEDIMNKDLCNLSTLTFEALTEVTGELVCANVES